MKTLIYHPITFICIAFALITGAWSVIITTALKHRIESVPVELPKNHKHL